MPKKWAHITMIFDGTHILDLYEFIEGKVIANSLQVRLVKHAGETEEGKLTQRPSGREFVLAYAGSRKQWAVKDAIREAKQRGVTDSSVYAATNVLMNEKLLKRAGPGIYEATKMLVKKSAPMQRAIKQRAPQAQPHSPGRKTGKRTKPIGTTMIEKVLAAVQQLQNGSDAGVDIGDIRKTLGTTANIGPYLSDLVKDKQLTRVAPGVYRAA